MFIISALLNDFQERIQDRRTYKLSLEPIKEEIKKLIVKLSDILETLK